jgi:hypothetical protein
MMARITAEVPGAHSVGDETEVVGFVHHGGVTYAVCRDDAGALSELPTWAIRILPHTVKVDGVLGPLRQVETRAGRSI